MAVERTLPFQKSLEFARKSDQQDPLAGFRDKFFIPQGQQGLPSIYLCGNSLGCQPKTTRQYVEEELEDWAKLGVEGHFAARHPWMPYHEFLTESTARLVGAQPEEVVVMNALTVNLHLLMATFYQPTPRRFKIMIEEDAFPSDIYAMQSQLRHHGFDENEGLVRLKPRAGEYTLRTEDILERIVAEGEKLAVILLGGVNYYTGQAFDMERITAAGHEQGCVVGFDLAHAAGNLHLRLHDWGVDFAAWCSYKYLNGGPGAVAGFYLHERHARNTRLPRLAGWWGHDKETRFKMPDEFVPIPTAEGWQLSNAPVLSMAALRASMQIFDEAGIKALREKSEKLTGYLEFLLQEAVDAGHLQIITPKNPLERGCQLSLVANRDGKKLYDYLTKHDVICDWREPDVVRVAPVPLYNSFEDVFRFGALIDQFFQG